MRQVYAQVPRGRGGEALEMAKRLDGANLALIEGDGSNGPVDLLIAYMPNQRVEELVRELQELPDLHLTLTPQGTMPLHPPEAEAAQQVREVQWRSPLEVFLSALQSLGSWRGFLGYAALGGVVVWIGLLTNTIFLLTAAMLLAPFAGPAMNLAIATARGDWRLAGRSVLRYLTSLVVTIVVTAVLSLIFRLEVATGTMIDTSTISIVAVLLPLAAGAGGALNLVQSERSSLVSGAATGMLVAASLAPPAGTIGMASVLGEWEMVRSGFFLLLLQLVGINLAGSVVFRLAGLNAKGTRYSRGTWWIFPVILAATAVALVALLVWQWSSPPNLRHASRAARAVEEVQSVVEQSGLASLVEADVRFTRANIPGQNTLLAVVYVQRDASLALPSEVIRTRITQRIQARLLQEGFNVTPLVDVQVLDPPMR
ncbi:MAG TPA: TIGR00341 family protein [Chloroflexota bacterium]|nr:TIGR00341 family protein [Chloroflexota bacterium]